MKQMAKAQSRSLERLACSIDEAAEITSLSKRKIDYMVRDGRLKSIRIDGRRLIYMSSVKALLPDA
jgi:excisionase family DNA binding protein